MAHVRSTCKLTIQYQSTCKAHSSEMVKGSECKLRGEHTANDQCKCIERGEREGERRADSASSRATERLSARGEE